MDTIVLLLAMVGAVILAMMAVYIGRATPCALLLVGCTALVAMATDLLGAWEIAVVVLGMGVGLGILLLALARHISGAPYPRSAFE